MAWSDKTACIATYNILEADELLNQFDRAFLRFSDAGQVKLAKLPYFPKFEASPADLEGRAAQMARNFFKFLIVPYTNRKERPADTIEQILAEIGKVFESKSSTIADLADVADKFLKFKAEIGGSK